MAKGLLFLTCLVSLMLAVRYSAKKDPAINLTASQYAAKKESKIQEVKEEAVEATAEAGDGYSDGILDDPDLPGVNGYASTKMKDIQPADPAEGISLIKAPIANNTGNAVLSFDMKFPNGRLDIEPEVSIQYNNEGGNSWIGYGWNMTTPAIGIETRWGVPRYDAGLESEIYTINGEQLAPINNRSEFETRTAEKRFYPRVEKDFSKIIRHGNSPSTYWWEVTMKNGVQYYYGGRPGGIVNNAVLKDDGGHVGYWALVEKRDRNENFIRYDYTTVTDVGVDGGVVQGKQLYLSSMTYTGNGTTPGPYKIEFIRDRQLNEAKRKDITIDARLGFKMVSADLLRKVNISFNNSPIRSYEFAYEEGPFYKSLLKSISEIDDANTVFYKHTFEYFDDVNKPANYNPSAGITTWTMPGDGIKGDIVNPIEGFTGEGSSISTSKAESKSGGVAITLGGITGGTWSKNTTIGGQFNYGEDDQEGLVAMVDINGDGLPDKVFKEDGKLSYRRNLGGAVHTFGEKRPIIGVNDFNTSNSKNVGGGAQVVPPSGFLGYNHTTTTTTSKIYFTDFNGDGLMDLAYGGRAMFNHLDGNGDPVFEPSSTYTPSPIFSGSVDQSFFAPDTALQSKQERDFPLQDIIRVWQAPFAGTVSVTAPVSLVDVPDPSGNINPKRDGVRASIQIRQDTLWSRFIGPTDFTVKTPTNVNNLTVNKGDRIYFRLQSIYNGEGDLVDWDPIIQYSTPVVPGSDIHHKTSNYYRASADFIMHSKSTTGMGKIGTIRINGTFKKIITSDSVWLQVTRNRAGVTTTLFEVPYGAKDVYDGDLLVPGTLAVIDGDELHFRVFSKSYIDRSALSWKPHWAYIAFADATPVNSTTGEPTIHGFPIPDNSNYNYWRYSVSPITIAKQDTVTLWPQIFGNGAANGSLWFTIKGIDTIYARRFVTVTNGNMSLAMDSIKMIRKVGEVMYMEFATDSSADFEQNIQQPAVQVIRDSISATDTTRIIDTINANLYMTPPIHYFGPLFRGWGQFAFKGDKGDGPLQEALLNTDELNNFPTDPGMFQDSTSFGNIPDPSKTNFVMLSPDIDKNNWHAYDSSVYVMAGQMSSSRLYVHDVSVDSLMAGGSAGSVYRISTTETDSYSAGATPGISASAGTSLATTVVNLDMMDMNGDRYPDVISGENIQYTMPHGGLGTNIIGQPVGETENEGWSVGLNLGGNFIEASTENKTSKGSVAAQKTAKNSAGLSGNINRNDDESNASWIDINGDGLVDRVYKSGVVQLNLGYSFAPGENWNTGGIDRSTSYAAGAGVGVNIEQSSFEAGFGLSRTVGDNSFLLNDVNGDGLPDKLSLSGSDLNVSLNTGSGFGPYINWKTFSSIVSNVSTGESINSTFTIPIIIPIPFFPLKLCIVPSVNIGHGVSRQQTAVMDVDGDGYADMLHSDNDGHLTASASTIGRTNMLKKVKGPLAGSYFSMDYERVGNTYDLPISKWVMKSVEVYDGAQGDGIDTMRQRFSYSGGFMSRHERDFYGFKQVITSDLNTANKNIVYRNHVKQYLNTTYYNKGLLELEWTEDATGKKYSQTKNSFEYRALIDSVMYPYLTQTEKSFFEGTAIAGVKSVKSYTYDAIGNVTRITDDGDQSQQDMIMTDITYHDIDNLYIKATPATITVTTAEGVKRQTITTVDATGGITRIRKLLADGTPADTDIEYDVYGNITKLTKPANYKGQRMSFRYEYDDQVHSYITKTTDAFDNVSTNTYEYKFGALLSTVNMNNEQVNYTIDNRGRIATITGPYEIAAGKPYSLSFTYNTDAPIPYTVTNRYDPEHGGNIITLSYSDGLGRNIQVKKLVSLFKGKGVADDVRLVVSGSDLFDAFGRVEQSYYPITEPLSPLMYALNTGTGLLKVTTAFDVADRAVSVTLVDGSKTTMKHTGGGNFFNTLVTDALNNQKEVQSDVRGRKRYEREYGPNGTIVTRYDYDALSELVRVVDGKGNIFASSYDNLGRRINETHPDAGRTEYVYDVSGNLLKKTTAQIKKEIPNGGAIQYQYDFDRLTDIDYPRQYQNKVKYVYGKSGTGAKAGRIILQMDGSGGQEFFYGKQGEVIKTIRTILTSPVFATTFVSEQEYDSWYRLKKMVYPDGEEVRYHYNRAGGLSTMEGTKLGSNYSYIQQLGYDEFEDRVYMRYGNGTETKYTFENKRRNLVQLQATTKAGAPFMNNDYTYDAVNNLTSFINNVQTTGGGLGGYAKQEYHYDKLYRIDSASGEYKGSQTANFGVKVGWDDLYNITHKTMKDASGQRYDMSYTYTAGAAPHQASQIGQNKLRYDLNGNQTGNGDIENFWDEENRLIAVLNQGMLSQYTYDADGIRVVKSSGGIQGIWVNGAPAGAVRHTDNYTVYVSPFVTSRRIGYTKHYYIGEERIATKLGHGAFTNISFPTPALTAGNVDYTTRAQDIERARLEYYASLGVSPGPPTDKNFWARPENSGIPAPVYVDTTSTMVPPGWPGNTTPPTTGPPIFVDSIPSNDSVKAGYGFSDPGHVYENDQHYYHLGALNSNWYVTNTFGEVNQHIEYSPFGEIVVEEHTGSYQTPYLFNTKGRDEETGYYNYGDLYYEPVISQWLSVDMTKQPYGSYFNNTNEDDDYVGGSASISASAVVSDIQFADAGIGMQSEALVENEGNKKGKKENAPSSNRPANPAKTAANNKGSAPKSQNQNQNMAKRGFKQLGGGAIQGNGMFFNHQLMQKKPTGNNGNKEQQQTKKLTKPITRPRR